MSTWSFVDNIQESRCVDQSGWLFQDGKKDGADKKGTGKSLAEEGGRGSGTCRCNYEDWLGLLNWLSPMKVFGVRKGIADSPYLCLVLMLLQCKRRALILNVKYLVCRCHLSFYELLGRLCRTQMLPIEKLFHSCTT